MNVVSGNSILNIKALSEAQNGFWIWLQRINVSNLVKTYLKKNPKTLWISESYAADRNPLNCIISLLEVGIALSNGKANSSEWKNPRTLLWGITLSIFFLERESFGPLSEEHKAT